MTDEEIKQRAIRRTGRVIQAMNALHDVIVEFPEAVTQPIIDSCIQTVFHKVMDMTSDTPEEIFAIEAVNLNLPENMQAREPAKPRMPKPRAPIDTAGGLPIAD